MLKTSQHFSLVDFYLQLPLLAILRHQVSIIPISMRYNNKEFPYILLSYYILGVYTAETVHPKIRNNLTILPSIFTSIGMLSVWIIGFFAHWRTTAYIFMIPHIVIFLCMLPLPESPYWLIEANKIDLAEYD